MSGTQRLLLVVAAVVAAVVAFALLRPADEEGGGQTTGTPTASAETAARTQPARAPLPRVERIRMRAGRPLGGPRRVEVARGETIRIVVSADASDELHLHGYDITRAAAPGRPARFVIRARAEGEFELESHTANDTGLDARVLTLVVRPS